VQAEQWSRFGCARAAPIGGEADNEANPPREQAEVQAEEEVNASPPRKPQEEQGLERYEQAKERRSLAWVCWS
jgi:hypothetical protein